MVISYASLIEEKKMDDMHVCIGSFVFGPSIGLQYCVSSLVLC